MVCTRTLYNEAWAGNLPIGIMELPEAVKRKRTQPANPRENKKNYGKSIDLRPEIASLRTEEGHWEGDTVVGKRAGKDAVVFSLLEKKTENYMAFLIPDKTSEAVMTAMRMLKAEYGDRFAEVFKTITVDNGSEFADFAQCEAWGTEVFFAHPYTSWERPQNERHNGLFRSFVPKGASLQNYSAEYILSAADALNARPRKKLGYQPQRNCLIHSLTGCTPWVANPSDPVKDKRLRRACGILDSASRACCFAAKSGFRRTIFSHGCPTCTCNFRFENSCKKNAVMIF